MPEKVDVELPLLQARVDSLIQLLRECEIVENRSMQGNLSLIT